jgi:hypothetical protein
MPFPYFPEMCFLFVKEKKKTSKVEEKKQAALPFPYHTSSKVEGKKN